MKVLCGRDQLREALTIAASAIPSRTTKPVLEAVLLEAHGNEITISATDLEIAIRYQLQEVQVEREGACLIPAKEATEFIRDLEDEAITLETSKSSVRIHGKEDSCEISLADASEFPEMPTVTEGGGFELPSTVLETLIERTAFAAARESGRFAMNGVRFEVLQDRVRLIATDGRRLSLVEAPLAASGPEISPVTVPSKAVQQFVRLNNGQNVPVEIRVSSDRVSIKTARATIVSRLLEGDFPKYQAVIPREGKNYAECDAKQLAQKLRLVSHLAAPEQPIVRLKFTGSSLALTAASPQRGEARAEMPAVFKGVNDHIAFNPEFVLDGLKVSRRETVRIEFSDHASPGKFHLNENHEYVVMPVVNE